MAEDLILILTELKNIRTYLVKIGVSRRTGKILEQKRNEASSVLSRYNKYLEVHTNRIQLNKLSESEISLVSKICEEF